MLVFLGALIAGLRQLTQLILVAALVLVVGDRGVAARRSAVGSRRACLCGAVRASRWPICAAATMPG